MVTALISVFVITAAALGIRWLIGVKICPICAGVSLTWLWMLAARIATGYAVDDAVLAMLMGASVGGIAGQMDKYLQGRIYAMASKAGIVLAGFIAAYALLKAQWMLFFATGSLFILLLVFLRIYGSLSADGKNKDSDAIERLINIMKDCC